MFPIRLPGRHPRGAPTSPTAERRPRDGLIRDVVIPFNGVLVTRELVERIGLPREEFFIWGDDHEYRLRAERAGARIATVVDARRPPPERRRPRHADDVRPHDVQPQPERPQALLHGAQQPASTCATTAAGRTSLMFCRQDGVVLHCSPAATLAGSRLSFGAMRDGLRGDFTGHERYLSMTGESVAVVDRHLQPRRPADADAGRAGRARPASRTRSSSSTTPAPTTPARCSRHASTCRLAA